MKKQLFRKFAVLAISSSLMTSVVYAQQSDKIGTMPVIKNWTAPNYKMLSQDVVDEVFAKHSGELQSLTLQGVPPGYKDVIKGTMFAGTFPERIGKVSGESDVEVIQKGYMIIDQRYGKKDDPRKFNALMPLRDKAGNHIGLAVMVFNYPLGSSKTEKDFVRLAFEIRDEISAKIPSHTAMFMPK